LVEFTSQLDEWMRLRKLYSLLASVLRTRLLTSRVKQTLSSGNTE
jgi:hypothetical protein